MKKLVLGFVLVLAACGGGSGDKKEEQGGVQPVSRPDGWVDTGDVAPAGNDSVLGRWVSDPMVRGNTSQMFKFKITLDETTMAVVCVVNGDSEQVEVSMKSTLVGNKIQTEAIAKKSGPKGCFIPASGPRTYTFRIENNDLVIEEMHGARLHRVADQTNSMKLGDLPLGTLESPQ